MDSYNATLFALHSKGHSEYNMVNIVFIFVLEKTMMFAYLYICVVILITLHVIMVALIDIMLT